MTAVEAKMTFKRFLESADPLKDLEIEMFFRLELELTGDEAAEARQWYHNDMVAGDLEDATWEKIVKYVAGVSNCNVYAMSHVKLEVFALNKIADKMYYKYGVET